MSDTPSNRPWWENNYVWRPSESEEAAPPESSPRPPKPTPWIVCWRCGKDVPDKFEGRCPECHANLHRKPVATSPFERLPLGPADSAGLMPMIWFYIGILLSSVVQGILFRSLARDGELTERTTMTLIGVIEFIDSALVLLALAFVVAPPKMPRRTDTEKALAWLLGLPVLGLLLGINIAYHEALRKAIGVNAEQDLTFGKGPWSPIVLLMVCIQPAVIEELFFRYLALGTLRRHMGLHGAVAVSSVMFGLAHVGVPLSMPILCVIGLGLGYLRVASRSLILPMILHFLHNLVVIII